MADYDKLKEVFKDKLFHEQYDNVYNIFMQYISLGKDPKELLECLKKASLEIRPKQTIESVEQDEAQLLSKIFKELLEGKYLKYEDADYVKEYVEQYRTI